MRLDPAALDRLSPSVARFEYDRAAQDVGIVHFGIGAFHRAHQAWYTDRAMDAGSDDKAGRDWAIAGVSLRSASVADQLNPQGGLYTVTERSAAGSATRVIGAVREVVIAPAAPDRLQGLLTRPSTRIVSFTVTEKGYCRDPGGNLDPALAGADSFYPPLARALRARHDAGLAGLTLLSCDNLPANGRVLGHLLRQYLDRHDPGLLGWFERECACPSTMIDRIVPATTAADRSAVAQALGLEDAGAVVTEPFSQWVIEDRFAGTRPRWEAVGAELVSDVAPYETAKLRMLNGAHSALAYLGIAQGHEYVHEAIADPALRPQIERLMRREAATSLSPEPGQDLAAYADALLARFANPALNHRLRQIAMDGSQKIPQRWLETLAFHQRAGAQCPAILAAIAAWIAFIAAEGPALDDPMAETLHRLFQQTGRDGMASALFGDRGLFGGLWAASPADLDLIRTGIEDKA